MTTTVLDLQRRLLAVGFNLGPADGIAGPKTKAAVRIFQLRKACQSMASQAPRRGRGSAKRRMLRNPRAR